MIRYTCYPHYNLHGPVTRTCLADGSWSEKAPECLSEYIERSLKKQLRFLWRHQWFPAKCIWETTAEIPLLWRVTIQIWVVLLIGWKFASSNQKHYPDLEGDTSSWWNFCACFSDVISRENKWWRREMLAIFSGYKGHSQWDKLTFPRVQFFSASTDFSGNLSRHND